MADPGETDKQQGDGAPAADDMGSDATVQAADSDSLPGAGGTGQPPPASVEGTDSSDLTGQTLAERYTVLRPIGRGGMSVVYLARHELLKKIVAIKVLREEQAGRKDSMARFHREARAAASIGDPHIVDITDYGFTPKGDAFIVMEHLEGRSLRETIAVDGPLPAGRAVAIARQILRALRSAHDRGIIHRDLKADNVFVTRRDGNDFVKVLDFGISKITQPLDDTDAAGLTSTGQVLGTPQYLAPEQAHGLENVDLRADIYAMGVILYEMLTGDVPFSGKSAFEVVMKHVQDPPQPPRERRPDLAIPAQLEQVVLKALRKDPDDRYQTADEMLRALPASDELPGGFTSQSLTPAPRPGRRRRAWPVWAGSLVALALGGVGLWLGLRHSAGPPPLPDAGPRPDLRVVARPPDARPAPDARATVTVEVRAVPANARISVGDKVVGTGRALVDLPRGAPVSILVEARGYLPQRQRVTPQESLMIPIRLVRGRRPPPKRKGGDQAQDLLGNPYKVR